MRAIRQLLTIFSPAERLKLLGVLAAMLAMGVLQMAGVGVTLPFIALLTNPGTIHTNGLLNWLYTVLGFASTHSFLMFIGSVLLAVLLISNAITALTIWVMTRFTWSVQKRLSARLLNGYLHQRCEAFTNCDTAIEYPCHAIGLRSDATTSLQRINNHLLRPSRTQPLAQKPPADGPATWLGQPLSAQ